MKNARAKFSKQVYQSLITIYKPFLGKTIFFVSCGFIGRLFLLANSNFIGAWIDNKITFITYQQFPYLILALSSVGFLFSVLYRLGFSRYSARAISGFYDEVTLRTSRYPMRFFDTNPAGRIITRFSSDYSNLFRWFGGPLAEFLTIIFDLIAIFILIMIASPIYLIFISLVGVLSYFIYKNNIDELREARRVLSSSRSPSISHFAETTQGASTIRTFGRQDEFLHRFKTLDELFLKNKRSTVRKIFRFSFQMGSLSALLLLLIGTSSIYLVKLGLVSVGAIGASFALILLSSNSLLSFFDWLAQFEESLVSLERLDHYLHLPIENGNFLPSKSSIKTHHPVYDPRAERYLYSRRFSDQENAELKVNNLFFRYANDGKFILEDINFTVNPGERIGIIGKTGSGKSTLIQCLFYLYPIQSGEILINGQRPKLSENDSGIDLNLYRKSISLISQNPTIYQGTLRENIDFLNTNSDEKILSVLNQVGLNHWKDLNMRIEENGKNISIGEKQLVCMARTLLQDSPIVIMDEATSAVDPQSEEVMVKATEVFFSKKTQIIIAHRLSTLLKCDRVLWLDQGRVKLIGPTNEVLNSFQNQDGLSCLH